LTVKSAFDSIDTLSILSLLGGQSKPSCPTRLGGNMEYKLSKEHREKISKALKGKSTWNKGKTYSLGGRTEIICKVCGKQKTIRLSRLTKKNFCSESCYYKSKIGSSIYKTRGKRHHGWKGNNAAYSSIHEWIRRKKSKAGDHKCEHCGGKARDWANIDHSCSRDLDDYIPLCRLCHIKYDKGL